MSFKRGFRRKIFQFIKSEWWAFQKGHNPFFYPTKDMRDMERRQNNASTKDTFEQMQQVQPCFLSSVSRPSCLHRYISYGPVSGLFSVYIKISFIVDQVIHLSMAPGAEVKMAQRPHILCKWCTADQTHFRYTSEVMENGCGEMIWGCGVGIQHSTLAFATAAFVAGLDTESAPPAYAVIRAIAMRFST